MTIEGVFSQLIVKTNSNPKFDMLLFRRSERENPLAPRVVRAKLKALFKFLNTMKTLWYFIIFGLASVYSRDIYTSINWDPRNPM